MKKLTGFFIQLILLSLLCVPQFSCGEVVQTKINVKDHGAAGDGVTDDTKAILSAFQEVLSLGGEVYFPAGKYLTKVIDIKAKPGVQISVSGDKGKTIIQKSKDDPINVALFFCEIKDVRMRFSNLVLKGSLLEKKGYWIYKDAKQVDVEKGINGIYGYNLSELVVENCAVSDFHGKGIAAYNTKRFIARSNVINNTSGSGIMGHGVDSMFATNNTINNTGAIGQNYYLAGKLTNRSAVFPLTKFGDGIEGDCNHLIASNNVITNPGRCGIVHDLAKDLGYKTSSAQISNNQIFINSSSINNGNPPAGMWLEQSNQVNVTNNSIVISKSTSPLASGIRFYGVTGSITCNNNIIKANNYNLVVGDGIGVYEPETKEINLQANTISGKYNAAISISYAGKLAQIDNIQISNNVISGNTIKNGIEIAVSNSRSMPFNTYVNSNNFKGIGEQIIKMYYYGGTRSSSDATSIKWNNNRVNNKTYKLQGALPQGLTLQQ